MQRCKWCGELRRDKSTYRCGSKPKTPEAAPVLVDDPVSSVLYRRLQSGEYVVANTNEILREAIAAYTPIELAKSCIVAITKIDDFGGVFALDGLREWLGDLIEEAHNGAM